MNAKEGARMLSVLYNLWINEFHLHWKCLKFFLVCSKLRKYWSRVIVLDNFLRTEFPIAQLKHNMEFLLSKRDSPHSAALQNIWKNGNVVGLNGYFSLSIFAQDSAFFPVNFLVFGCWILIRKGTQRLLRGSLLPLSFNRIFKDSEGCEMR